jgi:hypothetical protein
MKTMTTINCTEIRQPQNESSIRQKLGPDAIGKVMLPIADIIIGERFRHDLGDIPELAARMKQRGQLVPIIVRPDNTLVKGLRRIRAAELNGWAEIWGVVAQNLDDGLALLQAQRDMYLCTKPLTISEAVAMAKTLLPMEQERARQRQMKGQRLSKADEGGRSDDKVAKAFGMGKTTLRKAMEICDALAADPQNPDLQKIVTSMDDTNRVKRPYDNFIKGKNLVNEAVIAVAVPPLTRESIFQSYPVICKRFQDIEIKDRSFIFGDLLWDQPEDYIELAKICAAGGLSQNGVLTVMVGSEGWLPILIAMSQILKFRTEIVYHCPGQSCYCPTIRVNANHKLVLIFQRFDATEWKPRDMKRSLVTSNFRDKSHHEFGLSVGGCIELVELLTEEGQEVFEVCSGGGTMAEACLRTGRTCLSVEEHEADCEIIRNRILAVWQKLNKRGEAGAASEELPVAELVEQGAS